MTSSSNAALLRTFAVLLICGAFAVIAVSADDAAAPQHNPDEYAEYETPELHVDPVSDEELANTDFGPLRAFCKSLHDVHHPYLAYRAANRYEVKLHSYAFELATHLEEAREKHQQQDHNHFSCADARDVLRHQRAKDFIDHFDKLMEGTLRGKPSTNGLAEPTYTNAQLIEKVHELKEMLSDSRLVNDEVIAEVEDIAKDLQHMENLHPVLDGTFDKVLAAGTAEGECKIAYSTFVKTLLELHQDSIPPWKHIDEGVVSLILQCAEDKDILDLGDEL